MKRYLAFFLLLSTFAYAYTLPPGLQAAADQTLTESQKVTFIFALLGGFLTILSPCILPLFPAFFAITFKEKKSIAKATLAFFIGFALVFSLLGLGASMLVQTLLSNREQLTLISGALMIAFGLMMLTERGLSMVSINRKAPNDLPGLFAMGALFAIGWTPCIGPVLGAILVVAAAMPNYLSSAAMLATYSIGIFIPLFTLSMLFDRYKRSEKSFLKGREVKIGSYSVHSTNLISAILLISLGLVFLIYGSTAVVNGYDVLGTKPFFYSLQRALLGTA